MTRYLPRTHAQGVKQSVLSVVIGTKIARSQDLGIQATHKHNESVEFGKKTGFGMFQIVWHGPRTPQIVFCWPCLSTAPTALQAMCFLFMRTTSLVWVGKGRQQIHDIVLLLLQLSVATLRSILR